MIVVPIVKAIQTQLNFDGWSHYPQFACNTVCVTLVYWVSMLLYIYTLRLSAFLFFRSYICKLTCLFIFVIFENRALDVRR
jgi:hypothetical protein